MSVVNPLVRSMRMVVDVLDMRAKWLLILLVLAACSDDASKDPQQDVIDIPRDQIQPSQPWSAPEIVAEGAVGLHLQLVELGSRGAVAFFSTSGREDGPCEELGLDDPPLRVRWTLSYAERTASGWVSEVVTEPLYVAEPPGLSLGAQEDGTVLLAAMTGEPIAAYRYCGANNVGLLQRQGPGQWSLTTVVSQSGEAATGEPASDFGQVVGYFPSLAFAPDGSAGIAYKDVHAGGMQSDDFRRADLELALRSPGGAWRALAVDHGRGAGNHNVLRFDADNQPYIAYINPSEDVQARLGLWVSRPKIADDGWERVQLYNRRTVGGPAARFIGVDSPSYHVAFYNADRGFPVLAQLLDPDNFDDLGVGWTLEELGDPRFDEGYFPALAVGPGGEVAMAYYRCTQSNAAQLGDCSADVDALVFAWRDGKGWNYEVVDEGDLYGACGMNPSLVITAGGVAQIAYRCERWDADAQQLVAQVRFVQRRALP